MKLSRTNLVVVLTIMAAASIGGLLTFSPLVLWSPADDVAEHDSVVVPTPTVEAATPAAVGRGIVTGRITEEQTGESVAAMPVYISSLKLGDFSQQDGRYLLENVPAGEYTVTANLLGYRTAEAQITVGGGQTVEQNFSVAWEAVFERRRASR